jgi:energy-coupling factor transporter ATP-binding protein EcfA2
MNDHKIIFTGPVGAGKSTAIRSLSDIAPVSTDEMASDITRAVFVKIVVTFLTPPVLSFRVQAGPRDPGSAIPHEQAPNCVSRPSSAQGASPWPVHTPTCVS